MRPTALLVIFWDLGSPKHREQPPPPQHDVWQRPWVHPEPPRRCRRIPATDPRSWRVPAARQLLLSPTKGIKLLIRGKINFKWLQRSSPSGSYPPVLPPQLLPKPCLMNREASRKGDCTSSRAKKKSLIMLLLFFFSYFPPGRGGGTASRRLRALLLFLKEGKVTCPKIAQRGGKARNRNEIPAPNPLH